MALDVITGVGIGVLAGAAAGAFSSYLGWNASGAPFEKKKFIAGISTGVIAGITLVFMNIEGFKSAIADQSGLEFVQLLGTIVLGTLGVDFFRAKLSAIIGNKETAPAVEEERRVLESNTAEG